VGDVGTVRVGRQRSPDTVSNAFPTDYLRAANITQHGLDLSEVLQMDFDPVERQIYELRVGDIVLAEASGSAAQVGRAAVWSGELPECCFQNTVIRFRPHAVIPQYALLVFQHFALSGSFASVARGVGIQHLGAGAFSRMPFPTPPRIEQERIAAEAERQLRRSVDARESIESALSRAVQQDNVILEAAAFGGLIEPTGEPPIKLASEDVTTGLSRLFADASDQSHPNAEFADLLCRALPPGWRWIRVDQAGEVRLGRQRSPAHEYGEHMLPYLRVANVFEDRIDARDLREMNFTPKEQESYRLAPHDILLNEGQSPELVGRCAMYAGQPEEAYFQNTLVRFRHADHTNPHFALLVFRHYLRSGQFTRIARWSTNLAHLGAERFAEMPFPLPPRKEQDLIVAEATSRLESSKAQRASLESSIGGIEKMRNNILRSAVSGQIVPQSSEEEPAAELLDRLGPPTDPRPVTKGKERRVKRNRTREEQVKQLYDTLISLKKPVAPELLFKAAGYNPDSIADVEKFYVALREELGKRIQQRNTAAGTLLEAITDAAG
jgi:type I restriction enzyme S subunit